MSGIAKLMMVTFIAICPRALSQVFFQPFGAAEDSAVPAAISANGRIMVGTRCSKSLCHAIRWTRLGSFEDLGLLPGGFDSLANGVSADGQVVVGGASSELAGPNGTEPFRWDAESGMIGLGRPPEFPNQGSAADVSDDGRVIVGSYRGQYSNVPWVWTAEAGMVRLQQWGSAYAVSAEGDIIAGSAMPPHEDCEEAATLWRIGENPEYLAFVAEGCKEDDPDSTCYPTYGFAEAHAMTDDGGVIVGFSSSEDQCFGPAVTWTPKVHVLGTLPGATGGVAVAASSDASVIVGQSGSEPFVWTAASGMRALRDILLEGGAESASGWLLYAPSGISADGRIVIGAGMAPEGTWRGWIAYLDLPCYPDVDESASLDFFDFLAFVNLFNAGSGYADCDQNGSLDLFDFLCFVNAFNTGC